MPTILDAFSKEDRTEITISQLIQLIDDNELLREAMPILKAAFFANYKDTNAANELYDKIKAAVGGAE